MSQHPTPERPTMPPKPPKCATCKDRREVPLPNRAARISAEKCRESPTMPCPDCSFVGVDEREPREWTLEGRHDWPSSRIASGVAIHPDERVQVVEKDAHRAQVVAEVAEALRERADGSDIATSAHRRELRGAADFILRREADRGECEHDWFDPTNEVVDASGHEVCHLCGAIRKADR